MADGVGGVGGGTPAAGGGPDVGQATDQMQAMFAQSVQQNAQITQITTDGNTAKRAASAQPQ